MRSVTAVDAAWLADAGPMFFSLKEDYKTVGGASALVTFSCVLFFCVDP
jgi:hypothetical protein